MSRAAYHSRAKRGGSGTAMYNRSTTKKLSAQNGYQRMADVRAGQRKKQAALAKVRGEAQP